MNRRGFLGMLAALVPASAFAKRETGYAQDPPRVTEPPVAEPPGILVEETWRSTGSGVVGVRVYNVSVPGSSTLTWYEFRHGQWVAIRAERTDWHVPDLDEWRILYGDPDADKPEGLLWAPRPSRRESWR